MSKFVTSCSFCSRLNMDDHFTIDCVRTDWEFYLDDHVIASDTDVKISDHYTN